MLKSRMTFEEFLELPEQEPPLEWLDGEVFPKWDEEEDMPNQRHGTLQGTCYYLLRQWARPAGLGRVMTETRSTPRANTSEGSLIPDVSFISAARAQGSPPNQPLLGAPDLAVEILSPGQGFNEVHKRVEWFLSNGAQLVWVVDGVDRSVTVFKPEAAPRMLRRDQDLADEALPGFHGTVAQLFAEADLPEGPAEQP
ncbi:MAG TPA: Uma2 family endonuclease [Candidatus Xenobia bacterium]|jgi:Uma2 family endonuclease